MEKKPPVEHLHVLHGRKADGTTVRFDPEPKTEALTHQSKELGNWKRMWICESKVEKPV